LACGAAAPVLVAVLFLATPAQAAPSGQPASPSPAAPGGLPIHLPLSGIKLPINLPLDLGILTGANTTPPNSTPPTAKLPPAHSGQPATGTPRPHPDPSAALGAAAQTSRARAAVAAGATTNDPTHHSRRHHKHRRHLAKPRAIRAAAHRDGKAAADLVDSLPVHAPNVELLLGIIALFCLGVIGIVTVSGRRGRPERKHRR
jgi:hypothetical protein